MTLFLKFLWIWMVLAYPLGAMEHPDDPSLSAHIRQVAIKELESAGAPVEVVDPQRVARIVSLLDAEKNKQQALITARDEKKARLLEHFLNKGLTLQHVQSFLERSPYYKIQNVLHQIRNQVLMNLINDWQQELIVTLSAWYAPIFCLMQQQGLENLKAMKPHSSLLQFLQENDRYNQEKHPPLKRDLRKDSFNQFIQREVDQLLKQAHHREKCFPFLPNYFRGGFIRWKSRPAPGTPLQVIPLYQKWHRCQRRQADVALKLYKLYKQEEDQWVYLQQITQRYGHEDEDAATFYQNRQHHHATTLKEIGRLEAFLLQAITHQQDLLLFIPWQDWQTSLPTAPTNSLSYLLHLSIAQQEETLENDTQLNEARQNHLRSQIQVQRWQAQYLEFADNLAAAILKEERSLQ